MSVEKTLANFNDIPESFPRMFRQIFEREDGQELFEKKIGQIKEAVKDGLTTNQAITLVFKVSPITVKRWEQTAITEWNDGKTDTPLIAVFSAGISEEYGLIRNLKKKRLNIIEEENDIPLLRDAIKPYDKNETRNGMEISSPNDTDLNIIIGKMTDKE